MAYTYEYLYKIEQLGVCDYTLKITDEIDESKNIIIPIIVTKSKNTEENLKNIACKMILALENEEIQQLELSRQKLETEEIERVYQEQKMLNDLQNNIIESSEVSEYIDLLAVTDDNLSLIDQYPQN